MSAHYILDGHQAVPCDLMTWAHWIETAGGVRRVAEKHIGVSRVSTVFLGLNHAFDDGPPLIFETMVFSGPLAETCERYSTWEEAERGHAEMVSRVLAYRAEPTP